MELTAFGSLSVSGMNVIRESKPDALAAFPFWASALLSGVPGTAITAIVLNLILREKRS